MPVRSARASWEGDLKNGKGSYETKSGACKGKYSFGSRFEENPGSNPEELIGAAEAGCFSMDLSHRIATAGYKPSLIETEARVHLEKQANGYSVTMIQLNTSADVADIEENEFQRYVNEARENCPISRLLNAKIEVEANLIQAPTHK